MESKAIYISMSLIGSFVLAIIASDGASDVMNRFPQWMNAALLVYLVVNHAERQGKK